MKLQELHELHELCGIYTRAEVVSAILDGVMWRPDVDLSKSRLLEPAAGDGAFIVEAAVRLVRSLKQFGVALRSSTLRDRIQAFEIHPDEAEKARIRLAQALRSEGLGRDTALSCAQHWVRNADFLLETQMTGAFSHAVGNPPYVRWSKIPAQLKAQYNATLRRDNIGGDLYLPFLDHSLSALRGDGHWGMICSDRWRFSVSAEAFRQRWLPNLTILLEERVKADEAFTSSVEAYPSIIIARKCLLPAPQVRVAKVRGVSLADLGCTIKVGPALGCASAFVLETDEHDVEECLLYPWLIPGDIGADTITHSGRRVVAMSAPDGSPVKVSYYPRLYSRLRRHKESLMNRYIVRKGAQWYRPIDRVRASDWSRPKILVPDVSRIPRCAIDRSGVIPSHGIYALFVDDNDVDRVYAYLRDGKLAKSLRDIAPRVNGGYSRCYRRFLELARYST